MEGLAGYCAKLQRAIIVTDVKMSLYYDEKIDIKTFLSILCFPILKIDIANEKLPIDKRKPPVTLGVI
jgi:hypothetical protein